MTILHRLRRSAPSCRGAAPMVRQGRLAFGGIIMPGERGTIQEDLRFFQLEFRPYLVIAAVTADTATAKAVGTLMHISTSTGAGGAALVDNSVPSVAADGFGVVVNSQLTPGVPGQIAVYGIASVNANGTISAGDWVAPYNVGNAGSVTSMNKGYAAVPIRPNGAIGFCVEAATGGQCSVFLLGFMQSYAEVQQEWKWRVDFLACYGVPAGTSAALTVEGIAFFYNSNGGTPATLGYLGSSSSLRIVGDGAAIPHITTQQVGAAAGTVGTLLNPGGSTGSETWEFSCRAAQVGAAAGTRRIGLAAVSLNTAAEPANGVYFRHTLNGNIICVVRSGAVESTIDSGIATVTGTYHRMRAWMRANTGAIHFTVDDLYQGSITTNIPNLALGVGAANSVVTAANGLDIDYLELTGFRPA